MILRITEQDFGYYKFELDGFDEVQNQRNLALLRNDRVDFKTFTGANIIMRQNLPVSEVELVDIEGNTLPNTSDPEQFKDNLDAIKFFDWQTNPGGGSGGVDRFSELIDVPAYQGNNEKTLVINTAQNRLDAVDLYNKRFLSDLDDVAVNELVENSFLAVKMVDGQLKWVQVPSPNTEQPATLDGFTILNIVREGGEVTITTPASWTINGNNFVTDEDYETTIEPTVDPDSRRIDIIVAKQDGTFEKKSSEEEENPQTPIVLAGELLATTFFISGDNISGGGVIIGDDNILKSEQGSANINGTGGLLNFETNSLFGNFNLVGSITQLNRLFFGAGYDGYIFSISNLQGNAVTLPENNFFKFQNELDYTLKPNEVVWFRYSTIDDTATFRGSNLDFISRFGTEGRPIVGDLEIESETDFFIKKLRAGTISYFRISDENQIYIFSGIDAELFGELNVSTNGTTISFSNILESIYNSISAESNGVVVSGLGLFGNEYFDKQSDPNAFAQMLDVDNAVQSQTLDQTLGNGNVTDKAAVFQSGLGKLNIMPPQLVTSRIIEFLNTSNNVAFRVDGAGAGQGQSIVGAGGNATFTYRTSGGEAITANSPVAGQLATNPNHLARFDQVTVKANLSGGNNFIGNQIVNGVVRSQTGNNYIGFELLEGTVPAVTANGGYLFALDIGVGVNFNAPANHDLQFRINNDFSGSQMTFTKNKNLVVGYPQATDTGERLQVNGSAKIAGLVILGQFTTGTEPALKVGAWYFNTTKNRMMQGRSDGWLAIDELKSPNGSKWRLQVSDAGVLTTISA